MIFGINRWTRCSTLLGQRCHHSKLQAYRQFYPMLPDIHRNLLFNGVCRHKIRIEFIVNRFMFCRKYW